jgi:hypothetical protein
VPLPMALASPDDRSPGSTARWEASPRSIVAPPLACTQPRGTLSIGEVGEICGGRLPHGGFAHVVSMHGSSGAD